MTCAIVSVLAPAASATVLACPICFQGDAGPAGDGVRAAVVLLAAVTVVVLAGFGWFIRGFVRRSRALGSTDRADTSAAQPAGVP